MNHFFTKHVALGLFFTLSLFLQAAAQQKPFKGGTEKYSRLVWADEFNYKGLPDSTKWSYEKGYIRNKELQYYTEKRLQNARVENGNLIITALNDSLKMGNEIYPVTSACLNTLDKKDWTYGRIEVRAKIPSSLGTWPAIWMMGTNIKEVGWPACGELDIFEHVGFMPDTVHFNVHTAQYNNVKKDQGIRLHYTAPYKDFHVYAIEWFKDRIDWYMDDKKVFSYANKGSATEPWPFDKPQYLILNLAFGGEWGGQKGVNIQSLPQTFLIDYVRVYQ